MGFFGFFCVVFKIYFGLCYVKRRLFFVGVLILFCLFVCNPFVGVGFVFICLLRWVFWCCYCFYRVLCEGFFCLGGGVVVWLLLLFLGVLCCSFLYVYFRGFYGGFWCFWVLFCLFVVLLLLFVCLFVVVVVVVCFFGGVKRLKTN